MRATVRSAASLRSTRGDLMGTSEIGEGGKLVKQVSLQLVKEGRLGEFLAFSVDCAARLFGNRKGRSEARRDMGGK